MEWGEYDYVHNSAHVLSLRGTTQKEVAGLDNLYTLGMRGVHDGAMNGAKTIEEQKAVLTKVLRDQRDLLTKYVNQGCDSKYLKSLFLIRKYLMCTMPGCKCPMK